MNYPNLNWDEDDVPIIKLDCFHTKMCDSFIETTHDHNLSQMVRESTRSGSIQDLFLSTNPTFVNALSVTPGPSDHNIVNDIFVPV